MLKQEEEAQRPETESGILQMMDNKTQTANGNKLRRKLKWPISKDKWNGSNSFLF